MWNSGDVVMYSSVGVCIVEETREMDFCGEMKTYLVLKPVFDKNNTLFVPTFNEKMMEKIYPVLKESDALELISSLPSQPPLWIDNEKERKDIYNSIIENSDRTALVSMLKGLRERLIYLTENKKRLRSSDENFIKLGEALFEGEISYLFGIERSKVGEFIKDKIESLKTLC